MAVGAIFRIASAIKIAGSYYFARLYACRSVIFCSFYCERFGEMAIDNNLLLVLLVQI